MLQAEIALLIDHERRGKRGHTISLGDVALNVEQKRHLQAKLLPEWVDSRGVLTEVHLK
jgi:hypothetical protein